MESDIPSSPSILITGVTGFVGRSLLDFFSQMMGHDHPTMSVVGVSRGDRLHASLEEEFPFLKCHVADLEDDMPEFGDFDIIFHCATPASATMISDEPGRMLELIQRTTRSVISFAKGMRKAPRVVFASSGAVYDWSGQDSTPRSEDETRAPSPLDPRSSYGEGKRLGELLFTIADREGVLEFLDARMFAFAGRHLPLDTHFAIGNFVKNVCDRESITITGSPLTTRSYLDANDMCEWLWVIAQTGARCRPYHVGSDKAVTIEALAQLVADVGRADFGIDTPIELSLQGRDTPVSFYVPSTSRTQDELGLTMTRSLRESVWAMIDHEQRRRSS
jgi:nucleoside-diphosphate-sugar epimerase